MTNTNYALLCDILKDMDENELNSTMLTIKNKLDAIHVVDKLYKTENSYSNITNGFYNETFTNINSKNLFNHILSHIPFEKRLTGFSNGSKIINDVSYLTKFSSIYVLLDEKTTLKIRLSDSYEYGKGNQSKDHLYEITFMLYSSEQPLKLHSKDNSEFHDIYLYTVADDKSSAHFKIDIQSYENYSKYDGKELASVIGTVDINTIIDSIKKSYSIRDNNQRIR